MGEIPATNKALPEETMGLMNVEGRGVWMGRESRAASTMSFIQVGWRRCRWVVVESVGTKADVMKTVTVADSKRAAGGINLFWEETQPGMCAVGNCGDLQG